MIATYPGARAEERIVEVLAWVLSFFVLWLTGMGVFLRWLHLHDYADRRAIRQQGASEVCLRDETALGEGVGS
jgi:hypothetical protein